MVEVSKRKEFKEDTFQENILVVSRDKIFNNIPAWTGLKKDNLATYVSLIEEYKEFLPRYLMEEDIRYKQIIPYLIFHYKNKYFLMQRTAHATEQRLKNKYSLGIGGHIRKEDMGNGSLIDWAHREFHEEVNYSGKIVAQPLGILNDDSSDVGKVHLGFAFILHGDNDIISVKSELKSGELVTLDQGLLYRDSMESWTQIVFDALFSQK